jgi:hypothetical protein
MIVKKEIAVLGTLTTLLGVVSQLAVFFTRMEWYMLAPLMVCVYPAVLVLLFLIINSFESDLSSCLGYLFTLVLLYCMGLFITINVVDHLLRNYESLRLQQFTIDSSIVADAAALRAAESSAESRQTDKDSSSQPSSMGPIH